MISLMRAPSRSAGTAITYITVGVLMMIWTGVWYYAKHESWQNPESGQGWQQYVCFGLFLSGLAVTVIGLLFGQLGGAAKEADNTVGVAPAGPVAAVPGVVPGAVAAPGMVAQPGAAPAVVAQPGAVPQTVR